MAVSLVRQKKRYHSIKWHEALDIKPLEKKATFKVVARYRRHCMAKIAGKARLQFFL